MTDMSMISAQIDELRERAKELRNLAPDPDVPYLVPSTKETMALAMRSAAGEMEDAVDTIWQLRDDLQRTNAENAKLREDLEFERSENGWAREFLNRMGQKCGTKDCPSLVAYVTKLEAENAKLRELVADMWGGMCDHDLDICCICPHWQEGYNGCEYHARMRELGVEP